MALTRRKLLLGGGAAVAALGGASFVFRRRIRKAIDRWTTRAEFSATPPLLPHDPVKDATTIYVAQGGGPAANVDAVLGKLGGMQTIVGGDDVVLVKVAAQWWNTGMTNVAAAKQVIDAILAVPGFRGEVIVIENTHFRLDGSGLSRAWTHPSEWNVDVPGMDKLGDLIPHYRGAPVSFVGLIDAGPSALSGDEWWDPGHGHGVYGGDERGPIGAGEERDGYFWDFGKTFRLRRSWVADAQTPLTWPRFTSPHSGLVIDLRDGVVGSPRRLRFVNVTTCNEHMATGMTGACKSPMGLVDMSAGALGTHPRVADYQSIHYFGRLSGVPSERSPTWRMAGPLAFWCANVRAPDLYVTAAEWVAVTPPGGYDQSLTDMRQHPACRFQAGTIIAGTDPVAIDAWATRHLIHPRAGATAAMTDLDDPDSKVSRFLRYYRQTAGRGTLDPELVTVASMATWAIGDVQGCMTELERLLERIALDPARDRLWLVGDLVNRGPRSLDVLRWAYANRDRVVCVLGNHDLHLLQRAAGVAEAKKRDTLDAVLAAPDRDELIDWLRRRPLVHVEGDFLLCHAGLHPQWSAKKARKLAAEIEEGLASDGWKSWIALLGRGKKAPPWRDNLDGAERLRAILSFLARARCLDDDGVLDQDFDDHPRDARRGLRPWFDQEEPAWGDHVVVFGHWAMMGLTIGVRHIGLDSGCVWGRQLTAMRLDDAYVVQVPAAE